jgi:hypothetical protein
VTRALEKGIDMRQPTLSHHEFGILSLTLIAAFVITFAAAICVDLAGLLQYFGLINALPLGTLELAAAITSATVVPLLVMGMSISSDMTRNERSASV